MSRYRPLLWAALALALSPVRAQTPPPPWAATVQAALPPAEQVQAALERLPAIEAARAGQVLGRARQERLAAGPHEWTVKAGVQRRAERNGPRMGESELGLERGLRGPDKQRADQAQGQTEAELGDLAFEDRWHESARALLQAWFDWLRAARADALLDEQASLVARQLDIARRRQRAGEAARLELLQAEAETGRAQALRQQARLREQLLRRDLAHHYAGLQPQAPATLPAPARLDEPVAQWVDRVLDDNHELALAEAQARLARQQAERSRLDRRADPLLGLRAARERAGQEQVLGLYLSLPLGGAGRRADEQAALAQADIAQQQAAETRLRVAGEAWRLGQLAHEGTAGWQALDAAREGMEEAARLSTRAYELGEGTLAEALQSRRLALEARQAAEAARLELLEHQARLLLDAHLIWTPPGHGH